MVGINLSSGLKNSDTTRSSPKDSGDSKKHGNHSYHRTSPGCRSSACLKRHRNPACGLKSTRIALDAFWNGVHKHILSNNEFQIPSYSRPARFHRATFSLVGAEQSQSIAESTQSLLVEGRV
jgi:hypothetical protein